MQLKTPYGKPIGRRSVVCGGAAITQAIIFMACVSQAQADSTNIPPAIPPANTPPTNQAAAASRKTASTDLSVTLGPTGYAYDPTSGAIVSNEKKSYVSLYFAISATPVLVPVVDKVGTTIVKAYNSDQDLRKLDVTVELIPQDENENELTGDEDLQRIKVLALVPNQTAATTEDSDLGKAAKVTGAVGDILLGTLEGAVTGGLSPSSSLGAKLKNSSGGLEVIFGNLVPPQSVPTQYAFQQKSNSFGWYFRQHTRQASSASILGMHYGLVLLEIDNEGAAREIKSIKVKYRMLSLWRKPVDPTTKQLWHSAEDKKDEKPIKLPTPPTKEKTIANLQSLDEFPMLIPIKSTPPDSKKPKEKRVDVIDILQVKDIPQGKTAEQQVRELISTAPDDKKPLRAVGDSIIKSSLEFYLGLKIPAAPPQQNIVYVSGAPPRP